MVATLVALVLNLLFRIGIRKTVEATIDPGAADLEAIANVIERNAGIWGARRDVVNRMQFAVQQTIEAIIAFCAARGPIKLYISYDEFVIDAVLAYDGAPLEFPTQPPTSEEIVETEQGARHLAGFLIRRFADRMRATRRNDQTVVYLHFDH